MSPSDSKKTRLLKTDSNLNVTNISTIGDLKDKITEDAQAVIDELRKLLTEAEKGKIKGLIYIASYNGEKNGTDYADGAAGWYRRYPTDAVGQLDVVKLCYLRKALDAL